jgi:hypothetical protein
MRLVEAYISTSLDELKSALDGGKLVLYSTGRPPLADHAVTRSAVLATFSFASPAFGPDPDSADGAVAPIFTENPVVAVAVGTPSFARLLKADGTVVADLSAGPGATEVKLSEVSASAEHPIAVTKMRMPMPPETVAWQTTEFGHVFVTSGQDAHRKLSVRG